MLIHRLMIELSKESRLAAGIIAGVERQSLKKLAAEWAEAPWCGALSDRA